MSELVGNVKLNTDYNKSADVYSDGDAVEERMLEIAKSGEDLQEAIIRENSWPVLYHFSNVRHNILNWYNFKSDGTLLEIGAGCGGVTGLFCDRVSRVVANELSLRRSLINAHRNNQYSNLEIIVSNFEDMKIDESFDYVTLIGVLEYASSYFHTDNPFVDLLKECRSFLKDDGRLFIAIENKYGIKYWAGAREDHAGRVFEGIEDYPNFRNARTFSKPALSKMISKAGYSDCKFYYPHPDYKLPTVVFSDDNPPIPEQFVNATPSLDGPRGLYFDEASAMRGIVKDGVYDIFANSYLVECVK